MATVKISNRVHELDRLVDLDRYPIAAHEEPRRDELIGQCRNQLIQNGSCVLEGFVRTAAVEAILCDVKPRLADAYYCTNRHNPYLVTSDAAFPIDHPRNREQISDLGCLADDQINDDSPLRALYRAGPLRAFIAAILGVQRLYPYADPLGSLNVNVFRPGQQLGWHFDNADYAVTVMLQPSEEGGVYEYMPGARQPNDERYDAIAEVLDGDRQPVRQLAMGPGALVLFRGRYALHRVTPVEGRTPRLIAVLSYDTEPGVMLTEFNRRLFYGRVA